MVKALKARRSLDICFKKEKETEMVRFDQQHELLSGKMIQIIRTTKIIRTKTRTNIKNIKKMLRVMNLMKTIGGIMKQMEKNNLRIKDQ